MEIFHDVLTWIVNIVGHWGYTGIVIMMFLESSFFLFPSEVVIPPAGYLAARGDMSLPLVILAGIAGSILGSPFNYGLAAAWGRPFFIKYGRYLLVSEASLNRADQFFADHGHISTFVGRLLPVIRQYISLPAGIARMNLFTFTLYTGLGAGIWVIVLALVGYLVGNNQEMVNRYLHQVVLATIVLAALLVAGYVFYKHRRPSRKD